MKLKKLTAAVTVLALSAALTPAAFAAEIAPPRTDAQSPVTYNASGVDPTYTVIVPDGVHFTDEAKTQPADIILKAGSRLDGGTIDVSVASENNYRLMADGAMKDPIDYTLAYGSITLSPNNASKTKVATLTQDALSDVVVQGTASLGSSTGVLTGPHSDALTYSIVYTEASTDKYVTAKDSDFVYENTYGGHYLYKGTDEYVQVPDKINGEIVTNASYMFSSSPRIKGVRLPDSVNDMRATFSGCINLEEFPSIPEGVEDLTSTFQSCKKMTQSPSIPDTVTNMDNTFSYCTNLITPPGLPANLLSMDKTFQNCTSLLTAPEIPNSVTIMTGTFYGCATLTQTPVLPSSVTNISSAFYGCKSLSELPSIPYTVTNMASAFRDCTNISGEILVPRGVQYIGTCFTGTEQPITMKYYTGCIPAKTLSIPDNVTKIAIDPAS